MNKKLLLFGIYFIINAIHLTESAKILAIFPFPGRSQYILVQPYLKALAARGHELTVVNPYPSHDNGPNYTDLPLMEAHKIQNDYTELANVKRNIWSEFTFISNTFLKVTRTVLENPQVRDLLKTGTFDLVMLEAINLDALYSFGQHFGVPVIGISSYGSDPIIDELMGNPAPFAYVPSMETGFTENMSYRQRLQNVMVQLLLLLHNRWVHLPKQQELLSLHMPHIREDVWTVRRNISLFLLNQHFSLTFPRPTVPNMIEIGGFQIPSKAKPLPAAIREIIDNSTQDIIYFSMGSNVKSKDFSNQTLQIFNKVFAQLPYTILWKYENPDLPGKPSNVHINPWFPQTDILAEKKVKLFISHGGLLSTFESLHHGKPILGIPIFFDQSMNVNNAKKQGFALRLDMATLSQTLLYETILELMSNASYGQKAKEISQLYHDQPMKPLDLAIYWTEYILRHRGGQHLRSPAQKMDLLRSHSLDTVGVLLIAVVLILSSIVLGIVKVWRINVVRHSIKEKIN